MQADHRLFFWIGFGIYSFVVIFIGYRVWLKERRNKTEIDSGDYWAAGHSLSSWSVGLSISASMMSISWSCVYGVQLFYWYGPGGMWLLIIPWLITMAGFYGFTPLFRRLGAFSQPELLQKRFGTKARQLLAPALILVFITWTGAEIFAAGNIIAPFLGIPVPLTLVLISAVVAIYSYSGGFEAVVSTDKIQFALVALFISVIAVLGLNGLPEHFSTADLLMNIQPPKSISNSKWLSPGIALIVITFMAYLPGWLIETDVWVRLQAAGNNRKARNGVLIAAMNSTIFVGILPLVIGLAALHLYPPVGGEVPARLQDGALIFTVIMQDYAPVWLSVILSVGLIAAAMSTIDTCGNIVALSFSYDLLEPYFEQRWSKEKINRLSRWMSVAAIFVSLIYALFTDSLWDIFYLSSGILTTTVFLPVVFTFRKSTTALQIKLAAVLGFVSTLLFYFLESRGIISHLEPLWIADTGLGYILIGLCFSAFGLLIGKLKKTQM